MRPAGEGNMRTVAAELKVFGGKALIIFIFLYSIVTVFDLHIKKIEALGMIFEFWQIIGDEKSKSIAKDIKDGNTETPSDRTVYLNALQDEVNKYILNELSSSIIKEIQSISNIPLEELNLNTNNLIDFQEKMKHKNTIDGYIFIGNFDNNEWDKTMFAENVNSPGDIRKGEILTLTSNLYLRAEMPTNSEEYYRNIKSIKILPKGTKVTILGKPVGIKRQHATQWWVHVSY